MVIACDKLARKEVTVMFFINLSLGLLGIICCFGILFIVFNLPTQNEKVEKIDEEETDYFHEDVLYKKAA